MKKAIFLILTFLGLSFTSAYDIIINGQVVDTETAPHDIIINLSTGVNWSYYDSGTKDYIVGTAVYLAPVSVSGYSVFVDGYNAFPNITSNIYINTFDTVQFQNLNNLTISGSLEPIGRTGNFVNYGSQFIIYTGNNIFINSGLSLNIVSGSLFVTNPITVQTQYEFSGLQIVPDIDSQELLLTKNPFTTYFSSILEGILDNLGTIFIVIGVLIFISIVFRSFRKRPRF